MPLSSDDVRHLAALSRLALTEGEVEEMRAGLDAVLERAGALPVADEHAEFCPAGLEQAPLRRDLGPPDMMLLPPGALAPAWEQGFYVVPDLSPQRDVGGGHRTEPSDVSSGDADLAAPAVVVVAPARHAEPIEAGEPVSRASEEPLAAGDGEHDASPGSAGPVEWIDVLRPGESVDRAEREGGSDPVQGAE